MEDIQNGPSLVDSRAIQAFLRELLRRAHNLLSCSCCAILLFERKLNWADGLCFPVDCSDWVEAIRALVPWTSPERRKPRPVGKDLTPPQGKVSRTYFFPLHHGARGLLGALAVGFPHPGCLSEEATALAQSLADQASLLVVQALYRRRLHTVYALSAMFARLQSEEELVEASLRILREVFRYGHVGLYLRRGDELISCGGDYAGPFAEEKEIFRPFERLSLDEGICGRVFRSGKSALIPDVRRDPDYREAHPSIRSELAVPIVAEGEVLGLINVESPEIGAFNREDLELLESLGRQIGVALRQIRHRRTLEVREGLLRALSETADFDELIHKLLARAVELLGRKANSGGVLIYDPLRKAYRLGFWMVDGRPLSGLEGIELPDEAISGALRSDGPTLLADAESLWSSVGMPSALNKGRPVRAVVAIPVREPASGKAIAYLLVGTTHRETGLTEEDSQNLWRFQEEIAAVILRARDLSRIRELAFHDPLTGAYNRHFLNRLVERIRKRRDERWFPLSIVLVDIDSFSEVNDRFGHLAGDRVLREIASILRANVRSSDIVVRYGGDEFLILMPSTPVERAAIALQRLHGLVSAWDPGLEGLHLSISFGISTWDPAEGLRFEEALERADASLYRQREQEDGSGA